MTITDDEEEKMVEPDNNSEAMECLTVGNLNRRSTARSEQALWYRPARASNHRAPDILRNPTDFLRTACKCTDFVLTYEPKGTGLVNGTARYIIKCKWRIMETYEMGVIRENVMDVASNLMWSMQRHIMVQNQWPAIGNLWLWGRQPTRHATNLKVAEIVTIHISIY